MNLQSILKGPRSKIDISLRQISALICVLFCVFYGTSVLAQELVEATPNQGAIATMVLFSGSSVSYGDVVAFDEDAQLYVLADASHVANVLGVVVKDPALLLKPLETAGRIPVINSGQAPINVTLENGPITAGDPLAPSSIPGKARKATGEENIIGAAAESFTGEGGVVLRAADGTEFLSGTIAVHVDPLGASNAPNLAEPCVSVACRIIDMLNPDILASFVRYTLSGIIAAISLIFAFKSFMSDANYGVISIGRNPSAKTSIRSLVFFNAFLALAIASIGLFAAIVVLFAGI